jgi:hypothetical protein
MKPYSLRLPAVRLFLRPAAGRPGGSKSGFSGDPGCSAESFVGIAFSSVQRPFLGVHLARVTSTFMLGGVLFR